MGVGALVRFATLGVQSFDHDEAVTAIRVIQPNLLDTLHTVVHSERSPPLYYLLAWLWSKPFGTGVVALRALSALFGTLTIAIAYLATLELSRVRRAALVVAAFVALNPVLVWYSQEARSYALMVLWSTAALAYFARSLRDPSRRSLALWAAASILALLSHYFAAFLLAPEAIWLLAAHRRRIGVWIATGSIGAVGLALIPLAVQQEGSGRENLFTLIPLAVRAKQTVVSYLAGPMPPAFSGSSAVVALQLLAAAVGAGLVIAAVALGRRAAPGPRRGAAIAALIAVASLAVPFALAYAGPDFVDPRNLIGSLVPALVAIGIGLEGGAGARVGIAVAASGCALFAAVLIAINLSGQMQRLDWRAAASDLAKPPARRVLVVQQDGDDPLAYYLDRAGLRVVPFDHRHFPQGARVREVDTLNLVSLATAPSGAFRRTAEQRVPPFTLQRFRAGRPKLVQPADVRGKRVLGERSSALYVR